MSSGLPLFTNHGETEGVETSGLRCLQNIGQYRLLRDFCFGPQMRLLSIGWDIKDKLQLPQKYFFPQKMNFLAVTKSLLVEIFLSMC